MKDTFYDEDQDDGDATAFCLRADNLDWELFMYQGDTKCAKKDRDLTQRCQKYNYKTLVLQGRGQTSNALPLTLSKVIATTKLRAETCTMNKL